MSIFGNKAALCLLFDQVVNNGVLSAADETMDVNFVGHFPGRQEPVKGIEEYKRYVKELRHSFPDLHVKIEGGWLVGEDDAHAEGKGNVVERIVACLSVSGTHQGDYFERVPTGQYVTWSEVHLARCKGGRVAADQVVSDRASVLQQLENA